MNKKAARRLLELRTDYATLRGRPFEHFFCPILFRDEDVDLVRGHIINEAFPGSDRQWTVQRADVDSFFGSLFESDFLAIQHRGNVSPADVLADAELRRKLHPKLLFRGEPVSYYAPEGRIPRNHSLLRMGNGEQAIPIAIKLDPSELVTAIDRDWEVRIERDVRISAVASLIKAAHLTLFQLVGYSYALSAGGYFVGKEILGNFFLASAGKDRPAILADAGAHFHQFVNLARPLVAPPANLQGTISDRLLYLCTGARRPWAFLVFVRTGNVMHSVLVPILDDADNAARFVSFLKAPPPRFEVRLVRFTNDRWEVAQESRTLVWPAASVDPDG